MIFRSPDHRQDLKFRHFLPRSLVLPESNRGDRICLPSGKLRWQVGKALFSNRNYIHLQIWVHCPASFVSLTGKIHTKMRGKPPVFQVSFFFPGAKFLTVSGFRYILEFTEKMHKHLVDITEIAFPFRDMIFYST